MNGLICFERTIKQTETTPVALKQYITATTLGRQREFKLTWAATLLKYLLYKLSAKRLWEKSVPYSG